MGAEHVFAIQENGFTITVKYTTMIVEAFKTIIAKLIKGKGITEQ